jgi:acetolactate synthase-1/2/3 large subunit
MWTFPGNLRMQGDSGRILEQVLDELKAKATPRFKAAAAKRLTHIKTLRDERTTRAAKLAADKGKPGAINPHYLMAELGKVLDDDAIIFNEGVTNAGAVLLQIPRSRPNTTMRSGGGGLGWSGGLALGAKLAAPGRMMVQISGDGGFYFGNPSSVFAVSQQYKLPIFSIVMDNTGWNAVKQSTLRVFPEGEAKAASEFESELAPKVAFTKVGEAFGAYGEEIGDPADVPAAIARCLKEVRGGRSALLHARVTKM